MIHAKLMFTRAAWLAACLGALPPALAAGDPDAPARSLDAVAGIRDDRAVAERTAAAYAGFAGSHENALRLVKGMRSGKVIALRTQAPDQSVDMVAFNAGSGPMSWGEVHATLEQARASFARAGIGRPSASQIQAALIGGAFVRGGAIESTSASDPVSVPLPTNRMPSAWGRYQPSARVSRTFENLPGIQ